MTTPAEAYKQHLVSILKELKASGTKDAEAMWLLGHMAAGLLAQSPFRSWRQLKAGLTREAYDGLLRDFESQGNALHRDGKDKLAYAIRILGISVIGRTQPDPQLQDGAKLLDEVIDSAVAFYRKRPRGGAGAN
ncbi:hypothetical protein [Devosia sp.]|uniref:hypothetical protein n=1 Tax=Devosia sp. TaxID=1871048 RepID=UPI002EF253F0